MSDRTRLPAVVYVIPGMIVAASIGLAMMIPTTECTSGFDTSECADNTPVKWAIAASGIAVALVALGVILAVRSVRLRRGANVLPSHPHRPPS